MCVCVFRLPQPRARDMLDAGVIVALGSDFNPNAYCCSMVSTTPDSWHRGVLHDGQHSPHVSVLSTSLSLSSCTWPVSTWGCPCRRLWLRPPSTPPTPSGAPTHTAPWRSTNMETCSFSTPHGKSGQETMFRCTQRREYISSLIKVNGKPYKVRVGYIYLGTSHLSTLLCTCSFFPHSMLIWACYTLGKVQK